jgi:hypothetical protein
VIITEADAVRLWARVALPNEQGCMLWLGSLGSGGYARIRLPGTRVMAHRMAYELLVGPIPEGAQLDHLCRVRHCMAPAHLEPVTQAENIRRGEAGRHNKVKTVCKRGHAYTPENTRIRRNGTRACRKCALDFLHKYRSAKRATS